ncbi:Uncharacterised protein [Salmonella enterica subsp. enterica serovar Panama]|nr:Uncharacterised protein [Salmonella enterica subsp. enterica serovar Panama]
MGSQEVNYVLRMTIFRSKPTVRFDCVLPVKPAIVSM